MTHVLYNPIAANNLGQQNAEKLIGLYPNEEFVFDDITKITDIRSHIFSIPSDERIIISGGDGILNHLVNDIGDENNVRELYYFASGSGNDFLADIRDSEPGDIILLNKYIKNLPLITVNGITRRFINGIGYGIDGYCCEVGDEMRKKTDKPINYTAIAIKGLLLHFKPTKAKVTVDGVVHNYKKVWLAPTMNGRF